MIPGSKGLNPHEFTQMWGNVLLQDYSILTSDFPKPPLLYHLHDCIVHSLFSSLFFSDTLPHQHAFPCQTGLCPFFHHISNKIQKNGNQANRSINMGKPYRFLIIQYSNTDRETAKPEKPEFQLFLMIHYKIAKQKENSNQNHKHASDYCNHNRCRKLTYQPVSIIFNLLSCIFSPFPITK